MTTIRLDTVSRAFGAVRAVDDISLTVGDGEFFTLLGPSGCGKTTLLRMIAGFCDLDRGGIWFDDRRIDRLPAHRRNTGMVFQNYAIFPNLTIERNVAYGLHARRVPREEIAQRVARALGMVRLDGYGARWPHQLSGGQLQRVAIARSLVIEPAVLLFDEPLSNLDAQLRTQMRAEIRQLQQSLGLTAVYVTHDQEEALAISDQIAVLRAGRVEQVGAPDAIYGAPATAFVAEFVGATNLLSGTAGMFDGATTTVALGGGVAMRVNGRIAAPGDRVLLAIRPEALRVVDQTSAGAAQIPARLRMREFLGPILRLHAALPDDTPIRVSMLGGQGGRIAPGDALTLAYDPADVTAFPAA